jgi:hypothetical protein
MNFNGCCALSPHRMAFEPMNGRTFLSERFAIERAKVDRRGVGAAGDLTRNESFFTFGKPVLAVAGGRVVSVVNDVPENVPLNEPPASSFSERAIAGNRVILDLGHGRFAAYATCRPGARVCASASGCAAVRSLALVGTRAPPVARTCTFRSPTAATRWRPRGSRSCSAASRSRAR